MCKSILTAVSTLKCRKRATRDNYMYKSTFGHAHVHRMRRIAINIFFFSIKKIEIASFILTWRSATRKNMIRFKGREKKKKKNKRESWEKKKLHHWHADRNRKNRVYVEEKKMCAIRHCKRIIANIDFFDELSVAKIECILNPPSLLPSNFTISRLSYTHPFCCCPS